MANRKVVIATSTFYESADDLRARLAVKTIINARQEGYPIFVVDGGSPEELLTEFRDHGAMVDKQLERGMGPGRRQAMSLASTIASDAHATIWMEPEKGPFIMHIAATASPIVEGRADLVVPRRRSLESYPPEQADAEHMGNTLLSYMLGRYLDFWFGPAAVGPKAMPYFLGYTEGKRWGDTWDSIHVPRLHVLAAGLGVESVVVDYTHPVEQTEAETGDIGMGMKRIFQLVNLVPSLWTVAHELGLTQEAMSPTLLTQFVEQLQKQLART